MPLSFTAEREYFPVTLDEAKQQLRVDGDDEDEIIERMIAAATELCEKETNTILASASMIYTQKTWPWGAYCEIQLPVMPIRDVESVTYIDEDGVEQTVAPENYTLNEDDGTIIFSKSYNYPTLKHTRNAVRVYFDAGYDPPEQTGSGDDPSLKCPEIARQAILLTLGNWYANREGVTDKSMSELPVGIAATLNRIRVYR